MNNKLVTEHHLEFLSLKGGCTGLSESTLVSMPHCWKSCVTAHLPKLFEYICHCTCLLFDLSFMTSLMGKIVIITPCIKINKQHQCFAYILLTLFNDDNNVGFIYEAFFR